MRDSLRQWIATACAAAALVGCSGRPTVEQAWVRLNAVPGRPAAGYFTVYANGTATSVTAVSSTRAARVEMHEPGMRLMPSLDIASDADAAFAPGGRHLMLFAVDPRVKAGGTMPLRFTLADRSAIDVAARVVGPADPPPTP